MASGSARKYAGNSHYLIEARWTSNAHIAENYSDVFVDLWFYSDPNWDIYIGSRSGTIYIDGTAYPFSTALSSGGGSWIKLASASKVIGHNSDGSRSFSYSANFPFNVTINQALGNPTASGTGYLDTIPRASSISSGISFTAGVQNLPYTIARASSSFKHTVAFYVQKSDGTWVWLKQHDNVSTGGTFTFSVADNKAMYTAIGGYENRPAKILCITYNSGIEVGRKETIGTVYGAIPATINLNNFNIGTTSVPATLSNRQSNGNFYYKATLTFGSFTKSFDITTDSFNIPFTELEVDEMYQQVTTANSKVGNIHISSKYGGYDGVEINDNYPINQSKSFIAFVVGSSPIFTTFEYADTNATTNTIKGSGNESWVIQNKSTLRATVPDANKAEPQNYAIIDKYTATLNGETKTVYKPFPTDIVFDFGTVDSPTNINLVVKAYDSRGNVKSVTKAVKMVPWEKPEIRTQATRENGFGSDVTLTLEGDISPLTVNGEDKNSLVSAGVKYRQRQKNGTWGAYTVFLGQTITMPEYSVDDVWIDMNTTTAYEIEVQVTDKLGNSTSFLEVKVGIPIMHIDDGMSNVGINKLPAPDYALDISGDLATSGDIFEKGTKLEDKYAPTGVIQMFAGITTPPTGWLLCRGQAVSRETYTRLFSTIGVLYGAGDGSTTFNLPDLRGRVPIGVNIGDSDFEEVNKTGGEKTHTLTTNEIPSHAHNVGNYNTEGDVYTHTTFLPVSGGSNRGFISNIVSAQTGGGQAHNNLQPYITLNYIIRT